MVKVVSCLLFLVSKGPPTIIKSRPFEFSVNYPAVLKCKANGTSLKFDWISSNGVLINNPNLMKEERLSDELYETTYTIKKGHRQHNGQYRCLAQNEVGFATEVVTLRVLGEEIYLDFS